MSTPHTFSSRDFTRDVGAAKRAASEGPVFITDRGRPAFALLRIEEYYRLAGKREMSLLELMDSLPGTEGIEFEAPRADIQLKAAEFD
nr:MULTISPECIES: type II toxin-antitoxin system prevent-host-death family antitoxin [unclassified Variovorax]